MNSEVPEQSPKRKKGRGIRAFVGLTLLMTGLVTGIIGAHRWRETLVLHRVFVEAGRIVSAGEVVQLSKVKAGTPLYTMDLNGIKSRILSQFYIKSVVVTRQLPDALHIRIEERQPLAALSQPGLVFLDEDAVVLPPHQSNTIFDVPLITGVAEINGLSAGVHLSDSRTLRALALLQRARGLDAELYHLVSEVHMGSDSTVVLYSADAGVAILLGKDDEAGKLVVLKAFWKQFVHERGSEHLRMVDLRYADQVVVRWIDTNHKQSRIAAF